MAEIYYVAVDASGAGHDPEREWHLKLSPDGKSATPAGPLVLTDGRALVDRLDEVIFTAQPQGTVNDVETGIFTCDDIRVLTRAPWDPTDAAQFALSCAEHVLNGAGEVKLPSGATLAEVVADATHFLQANDPEAEGRLARIARLATARRLRRSGTEVGDLARGLLTEDVANELAASDDPAWTLAASVVDAVLAAVEALRHVALPRYTTEREEVAGVRDQQSGDEVVPRFFTTPWGNFAVGAEHESPYMLASHLAREAAYRARQHVEERDGNAAAETELTWQSTSLGKVLGASC